MSEKTAFITLACFTGACLLAAIITEVAKVVIGG